MTKKESRIRFGRVFKAYFFEESRRFDYSLPFSVTVVASGVEEALRMIRAEYPGRILSGLHTEREWGNLSWSFTEAVLISPKLARESKPLLTDRFKRVLEDRRCQWGDKGEPPSEVRRLRALRTTLAQMGYSDAHPAMEEILALIGTFEPLPRVL